MKKHPFATLQASPYKFDPGAYEQVQQWLVVEGAHSGNLWRETNVHSMAIALKQRHADGASELLRDNNGSIVLIIDPDDEEAVAHAAVLHEMSQYSHINEGLYRKALDEALDEYWADLDMPDRLDYCGDCRIDAEDLWGDKCPDDLRPFLVDCVTHDE